MEPVVIVNLALAGLLSCIGWWLLYRLTGTGRAPEAHRTPSATRDGTGSLSIIIPARNEQHNLPRLLRSIFDAGDAELQVIVADDSSTDGTREVAQEFGAMVVSVPPLAEGWRGKVWACHHGAKAATGDTLLFLDADTWLEAGALPLLRNLFAGGALSVGPFHHVPRPYEQLSAFFNLLMVSGTVPARLFGQMLMIDRASYNRVGGHEAVRGRTLENFHLARQLGETGIPVRSMVQRGLLTFRMYPQGVGELCRGWVKGFASGAAGTPPGLLWANIAWLVGMTLAVVGLAMTWLSLLAYALFAVQLALLLRRVGNFRWYASALYPIPLGFFYLVFTLSALRRGRTVTWKGRTIHAD